MRTVYLLWLVNGSTLVTIWGPAHSTLAGAQAECPLQGTWSQRAREPWDELTLWSIDKRKGPLTFWIMALPAIID